ncbi:MAG: radical SAM protein [Prevotella sp.]|jgi:MoaA/NifB/PqqE/SkfB family radical SAM enzyme|nr:radical SAM protein [Prevotella sp.]MCI2079578.1 radical SAM protein [Prevotella sp.]MCI2101670.1 radical SAM protein [Prevotella sp.]
MIDLQQYMSGSIRNIMTKAYKNVLKNPRQAKFAFKMQRVFEKSEKRRKKIEEAEGLNVPPFLITSISTTCNLRCAGCYARKNGIADDPGKSTRATMTPEQWKHIFEESAEMGINFALLAGGEPMMRKDVLEKVAEVKDMIFPIFTNGTLIGPSYINFLKKNDNMIPVLSLEGAANVTDVRRGKGVYKKVMQAMEELRRENLFFGTSITVTTENFAQVTSDAFVDHLKELGCKMIIYVEYVPTEAGTEHLAFGEEDIAQMEAVQDHQRERFDDMIIISFPGDEKHMGGCLAAGRGFFHIGPDGAAEPCPFSPFSDSNVMTLGVKGALKSPLFRKLRDVRLVGGEHTGGCALFEHRDEVEMLLNNEIQNERSYEHSNQVL